MPPRVSVVTPTYNREKLLPETIDSILGQTYGNVEYLVIDDGSRDRTRAVVEGYGDRVRYLYHPNQGEAATVNRGWKAATGDYFAVVSSDDPMLPEWLERSVDFLEAHPEVVVAYPDWQVIDDSSNVLYPLRLPEFDYERMVAWSHCMPGPGAVIRRSATRSQAYLRDPRYIYVSDLEAWMRLGLLGPFARIPHVLASWRQHAGAATVAVKDKLRAREHVALVDDFFTRPGIPPEIARHYRGAKARALFLAAQVLQDSAPAFSLAYYIRSLTTMPFEPRDLPVFLSRRNYKYLGRAYQVLLEKRRGGVSLS